MCAAPLTWASPEERDVEVGSAGTLADAFLRLGIQWPSTVAEGISLFFGATSVFAETGLAPGVPARSLQDQLADYASAGSIPLAADSDLAFSLVVLPVWKRMFPEYAQLEGTMYNSTAPKQLQHTLTEEVRRVAEQLVEMGIGLQQLRTDLLELPGAAAVEDYLEHPIWDAVLRAADRCARAAGPTATAPALAPFRAVRPGDEVEHVEDVDGVSVIPHTFPAKRCAADIGHRVRSIYRNMAQERYATVTRRGGDYVKGLPPHGKKIRDPARLSSVAHDTRARWLRDIYTLYVGKLVAFTINMAHMEALSEYYVVADGTVNQLRALNMLVKLSVTWLAHGEVATIVKSLLSELLSPGVAYSHPVTAEELRYWIWCALEREYVARQAVIATPVGDEAARLAKKWARLLSASLATFALAPGEIAALLAYDRQTVSAAWIDAVYTDWQALHVNDQLPLSAQSDTDQWVAELRAALMEHGALGGERAAPPSIQTTLAGIRDLAYARLFLFTFYEQHGPRDAEGDPLDLATEIQRIVSVPYAASMGHLDPALARIAELRDFLEHVWLPMTNTRSSPDILYAVRNHHAQLFIDHETEEIATGADVRIATLAPHGNNAYPLPARVTAISEAGVVRHVVLATREHCALNWHARFFRRWASRNADAQSAVLGYAARIDAYELDAAVVDAALRGELVRPECPTSVERFELATAMTTATEWPLYKEWTGMRIAWTVDVEFPSTGQRVRVMVHEFEQFARVLPPQELTGSSIWAAVQEECDGEPEETVRVIVRCEARAEFVIARPASATERVRANQTCIFTVRGKNAGVDGVPNR